MNNHYSSILTSDDLLPVTAQGAPGVHPAVAGKPRHLFYKRSLDLVLSAALLVVLLPFLPIVALIIALDSRGGVFFIQQRTGMNGKTFPCYKLRTMTPDDERHTLDDAKRITRIGHFLRRSHIDELPQLVNVLRGEMSLVGPRPHMISDTIAFEGMVSNYRMRHCVRPGITGLAQVKGYYGHVNNLQHLENRVKYDIKYVEQWSLRTDVSILIQTLTIPFNRSI